MKQFTPVENGTPAMNEVTMIEPAPSPVAVTTPAELLRLAVANGADLDRLERLMTLQERWEATEARKAYDVAFTAFKAEAVRIIKNKGVTDGPLKGKRYAELFAVVNAITPALSAHGLSASWKLTKDDKDWLEITCTLKHVGGHFEVVSMGGPPDTGGAKNAIQARASTVSYLERYTLKAITGLSEQDDDDNGGGGVDDPIEQSKNLGLTPQRAKFIRAAAGAAIQKFNENDEDGAFGEVEEISDSDEIQALWSILKPHSALRACLKKKAAEARARDEQIAAMTVEPTTEESTLSRQLKASIEAVKEARA